MPLAGIGNSVFHPADFGILNASVKESWLGRAYGVHTLGGNIGWALSPLIVLGLASFFGWRSALVVAGLIGFAVLGLLMTQASQLDDGLAARREHRKTNPPIELKAILLAPAIVLCFVYFMLLAIFQVGIQNFLPTILIVDGFTLSLGTSALTAFLFAASGGTILGAILADRTAASRLDRRARPVRGGLGGRGSLLCRHRRTDRGGAGGGRILRSGRRFPRGICSSATPRPRALPAGSSASSIRGSTRGRRSRRSRSASSSTMARRSGRYGWCRPRRSSRSATTAAITHFSRGRG